MGTRRGTWAPLIGLAFGAVLVTACGSDSRADRQPPPSTTAGDGSRVDGPGLEAELECLLLPKPTSSTSPATWDEPVAAMLEILGNAPLTPCPHEESER